MDILHLLEEFSLSNEIVALNIFLLIVSSYFWNFCWCFSVFEFRTSKLFLGATSRLSQGIMYALFNVYSCISEREGLVLLLIIHPLRFYKYLVMLRLAATQSTELPIFSFASSSFFSFLLSTWRQPNSYYFCLQK